MREMTFRAAFDDQSKTFPASFKHVQNVSDGGYDRGYAAGQAAGRAAGVADGIEQGKQAATAAAWEAIQGGGVRKDYTYAFQDTVWAQESFRPQYDIKPTACSYAFRRCVIPDLGKALKDSGKKIDLTGVASILNMFSAIDTATLPELDISNCDDIRGAFATEARSLHTIEKLIVSEKTGSKTSVNAASDAFTYSYGLKNIIFEGVWAVGLNTKWSPLSKESILSIFNVLSETATGKTVTLRKAAVNQAFETAEGANDGSTSAEWLALVATRPNWTIALG